MWKIATPTHCGPEHVEGPANIHHLQRRKRRQWNKLRIWDALRSQRSNTLCANEMREVGVAILKFALSQQPVRVSSARLGNSWHGFLTSQGFDDVIEASRYERIVPVVNINYFHETKSDRWD